MKKSATNAVNRTDKASSEEAKTSLKITKSEAYNPRQPIPRLCRVLKFDCKNRPGHLCCAHFSSKIELEETEEKISHTQLEQNFTKENYNSRRKAAQEKTKKRIPKFQRSKPSSIFDKSPVCKVIKCSNTRNKRHRCCISRSKNEEDLKTNRVVSSTKHEKEKIEDSYDPIEHEENKENTNKKDITSNVDQHLPVFSPTPLSTETKVQNKDLLRESQTTDEGPNITYHFKTKAAEDDTSEYLNTLRQSKILSYPGRVTVTITRVFKSYSWQ